MTRTLYRTLLGADFDRLPAVIRDMHANASRAVGCADIARGKGILARLICAFARTPKSGRNVAIETTFEPIDGGERWTRTFAGQPFRTDMLIDARAPGRLRERFGPFLFHLRMVATEEGTDLLPDRVFLWGVKLPRALSPEAVGHERVRDGRYRFNVVVRFPLAGDVLRYEGTIERDKGASVSHVASAQHLRG
jgi:hypothetical protein